MSAIPTPTDERLNNGAFSAAGKRLHTPHQILGPYYPVGKAPILTSDLTIVVARQRRAQGQVIEVEGHVLNRSGEAVQGARLIIWQANSFGRYAHPNDPGCAPSDPNFIGFAETISDNHGAYRFKTVKPGIYGAGSDEGRPPHIHFEVHGKFERLITQMYFPGEPLNIKDRFLMSARQRDLLIATAASKTDRDGHRAFTFDIVLIRG